MDLLESDEETAIGKPLKGFRIAGSLDGEGVAVAVEDRMDLRVDDVAKAPALVADDARDEPMPEIGDRDQPRSALVDDEA